MMVVPLLIDKMRKSPDSELGWLEALCTSRIVAVNLATGSGDIDPTPPSSQDLFLCVSDIRSI